MISKKSGRRKGKNFNKTYMKETEKLSIKPIDIEQLKLITFSNIIEGSRSVNGVTWNRIKNLKQKDKILCLKQLSQ